MTDYKEIPVKPDTKKRLYAQKRYGETWDETLARLAAQAGDAADADRRQARH